MKVPLWAALAGAVWMTIAIRMVALRAVFVTNYIGLRTALMLPQIGKEMPVWQDLWIFYSWLVVSSSLEWAFLAGFVQFVVCKVSARSSGK